MRAAASQNVNCPPSQVCSGMVHVLRGLSSFSGIKADGDEVSYLQGERGISFHWKHALVFAEVC